MWICVKYKGHCKECECDLDIGDKAFYENYKLYCEECGKDVE